jgi:hypothetical protein
VIEGIEAFYQRITAAMTTAIPEDWSMAEFHAIFFPDGSIYEAEYVRQADSIACSFQPTSDGSRAIRELRQAFQSAGQAVWGRIWFVLRADGSFNAKWDYDDCDANGDAVFHEEIELRRHEERRLRLIAGSPRTAEPDQMGNSG